MNPFHKIQPLMKHLFLAALLAATPLFAQESLRWDLLNPSTIEWKIRQNDPHADHIEMSGEQVSFWVRYQVDSARITRLSRVVMFPNFRMKPNDTHGTMMVTVEDQDLPGFFLNQTPWKPRLISGYLNKGLIEKTIAIRQSGVMQIMATLEKTDRNKPANSVTVRRILFPSATLPAAIERIVFTNTDSRPCHVAMEYGMKEVRMDSLRTTGGPHSVYTYTLGDGVKMLQPGDSAVFNLVYQAVRNGEPFKKIDADAEYAGRLDRIKTIRTPLQLSTPDPVINSAFEFAKLRAGESIYLTKNGYINSPGGFRYHAAIWANDQAEYTGPWYGYAGYPLGVEAGLNAYRWFARFMNPQYKPIPSSIIAEGIDYWDGAGDRGDQAMIAYGASRFALATGDPEIGKELWPLIEWCLEFSRRKVNSEGVVASDSDELEGRFPAGEANLCTSTLYYDALISASRLGKELGKPAQITENYLKQALRLKAAISKYFGAAVEGFETYRYYKGNDILRSWICMPLTVGIYDRKQGTVDALFSPRLWTADGLATQAGDKTFWDRSTLYGLRGVFAAGETDRALSYLQKYSQRRLLGVHVPYPVEAYPEGDQKHLSGESALYCRVITEGLFGFRPTGFRSFTLTPRLPAGWDKMSLNRIQAFGHTFDIKVTKEGKNTLIRVLRENQPEILKKWNGKNAVEITL